MAASGLLIALRMKSWDSSTAGYLKLSSVLEMYYSDTGIHGDSKYRGCNRLFNYKDPTLIDKNLLKEQVSACLNTKKTRIWINLTPLLIDIKIKIQT